MRIPFADPQEVYSSDRVTVDSPRELRRARALGRVPVLASGWDGNLWLSALAHADAVLLVTIDGDQSGVFFVPGLAGPPADIGEPPGPSLWAVTWRRGQVREEPIHNPRAILSVGDKGPHLTLVWEPGSIVDLDPLAGGICYLIPGAEYRRFFVGRSVQT